MKVLKLELLMEVPDGEPVAMALLRAGIRLRQVSERVGRGEKAGGVLHPPDLFLGQVFTQELDIASIEDADGLL